VLKLMYPLASDPYRKLSAFTHISLSGGPGARFPGPPDSEMRTMT
jgi:hypothetical protein